MQQHLYNPFQRDAVLLITQSTGFLASRSKIDLFSLWKMPVAEAGEASPYCGNWHSDA